MNKATSDNDKKEAKSINSLDNFLMSQLNWRFIRLPEKHIAIDGVIEIYSKTGKKTGNYIWVQVKTGSDYKKKRNVDQNMISLKSLPRIKIWRKIWNNVPGAIIFIYVDYLKEDIEKPIFYWVDLKDDNTYDPKNLFSIRIPKHQRLDNSFSKSFPILKEFINPNSYVNKLPVINMSKDSFKYLTLRNPVKLDAREFYQDWAQCEILNRTNPIFGVVEISRVGWQHITRPTRKKERIIQSFQLLSVAKEMIRKVEYWKKAGGKGKAIINKQEKSISIEEYFYLTAMVYFNHRRSTIVYVVLKQLTKVFNDISKQPIKTVWFYNIYEGERGIERYGS